MRNIRMTLEYDGTAYAGWQRQKNGLSIQQVLEEKIAVMTGETVKVAGSGRTDAGVHALAQVASFRTTSAIPERNLLAGLNSLLPRDIAVTRLEEAPDAFHARHSALGKVYLYRILNRPVRSALHRHYAWEVFQPLDAAAMREAASHLIGTHDFTSFCTVHSDAPHRVRTVREIEVSRSERGFVDLTLEADGFLRYMVRIVAGTLVEVGRGRRPPGDIPAVLAARDRGMAGITAPARGLFLKEVRYA
jgi:tRNA pseudouridine38-40 synthase